MKCPNCSKELKFLPKGKCTCSCGEIINSDGKDVEEFRLTDCKFSLKERLPSLIEIEIAFAIIGVIGFFVLRVLYQDSWLQYEADFMSRAFGIDQEKYKQDIAPFIVAALLAVWLGYKLFRKFRK